MSAAPSARPVAFKVIGGSVGAGLVKFPELSKVMFPVTGVPGAVRSPSGKLMEYCHWLAVVVFVKVNVTTCATPRESYTWTEVEKVSGGGPALAEAFRFKLKDVVVVAIGAVSVPTGI